MGKKVAISSKPIHSYQNNRHGEENLDLEVICPLNLQFNSEIYWKAQTVSTADAGFIRLRKRLHKFVHMQICKHSNG